MNEQKVFFGLNYGKSNSLFIFVNVAIHSNECDIIINDCPLPTPVIEILIADLNKALTIEFDLNWVLFNENFILDIRNQNINLYQVSDGVVELSEDLANEFVNRLYEFISINLKNYINSQ